MLMSIFEFILLSIAWGVSCLYCYKKGIEAAYKRKREKYNYYDIYKRY